eukprot:6606004-Prymnesium_polylepis.3
MPCPSAIASRDFRRAVSRCRQPRFRTVGAQGLRREPDCHYYVHTRAHFRAPWPLRAKAAGWCHIRVTLCPCNGESTRSAFRLRRSPEVACTRQRSLCLHMAFATPFRTERKLAARRPLVQRFARMSDCVRSTRIDCIETGTIARGVRSDARRKHNIEQLRASM